MADKKYYWLKLNEDFFDNLRMKKLRSIAGGDTYTIIYLKMQLLSLQNEGCLYYEGVENTFEQEIALIIGENVEDVKITIAFLKANNLLEEVETDKYELIETKSCIGSETGKAELMRRLREKRKKELEQKGNDVTGLLPDVTKCNTEIEKEKEKDIEIDKKKYKRKSKKEFLPPTLEEIENYVKEKGLNVNAKQFYDYFEAGNWIDAKGNKVKSWKQKILTWNNYAKPKPKEETEEEEIERKVRELKEMMGNGRE